MGLTVPNLTSYSQSIGAQASSSPAPDASATAASTTASTPAKSSVWTSLLSSVLSSSSAPAQPTSTLDVNSLLSNSQPKTNPVIYVAIIVVIFVVAIGGFLVYKATKK